MTAFEYIVDDGKMRLRVLRKYTKLNQMEFAEHMGIPYKKWNHYERGYALPRDSAFALVRKFEGRLTLGWLWFGIPTGMEKSLLKQLTKLLAQEKREPGR